MGLAEELPSALTSFLRAYHASSGQRRAELAQLLTQAFRAADAVADKFALYDLSARIIGILEAMAAESGDEATIATAAYVRAEVLFASGDWDTGRRMLERAADAVSSAVDGPAAAAYGALHMRAAVLAARASRLDQANAHIAEAAATAAHVDEGVYTGTAFGPASVQIHRMSLAVDVGDPADALRLADSWSPPLTVPAERRSHFFVDLADAQTRCEQPGEAIATLQVARRIAPQHVRYHPQVKAALLTLTSRLPSDPPALRELTRWTGVSAELRS